MAAEQNNTDLKTVVENLVSHAAFRRIVSDAVQQSTSGSGQNVTATTNVLPSPNASRATFSLPQQELESLFRTGGRGRGGGTVASFVPILGSSRFSAHSARSRVSSKPKRKKFSREVVLLSRSNIKSVVRGSNKADLMCKGQVIQCFEFCKEWTDKEVYENLREAFAQVLQNTRYYIAHLLYPLTHFIDPLLSVICCAYRACVCPPPPPGGRLCEGRLHLVHNQT